MNDPPRQWRKSSHSGGSANCVEISTSEPDTVAVRDSKRAPGPELSISNQAWSAFTEAIKHGEFDL